MAKPKVRKPSKPHRKSALFDLGLPLTTIEEAYEIYDDAERNMAFLHRAYQDGNFPALYEAITTCLRDGQPADIWMLRATQRLIEALVRGEFSYGPGPTGNPIAQHQTDWKHYYRYDAVMDVRRAQKKHRKDKAWLENESGLEGEALEKHLAYLRDPGRTWVDAYAFAAVLLKGTPAYGSPATMKRSYLKIKKLEDTPDEAGHLKVLSMRTRRLFGLDY